MTDKQEERRKFDIAGAILTATRCQNYIQEDGSDGCDGLDGCRECLCMAAEAVIATLVMSWGFK